MKLSPAFCFALITLFAASAHAASSTTIGSTSAFRCFEESRLVLSDHGIPICDRAIQHDELTKRDLAATYSNRGIIYANIGKFTAAIADHNKAISLIPSLGEAYINRGNVYYHTREYEKALADYQTAEQLGASPAHVAYYNMGLTLLKLHRKEEAKVSLEQALERSPDSAKIKKQLESLESL